MAAVRHKSSILDAVRRKGIKGYGKAAAFAKIQRERKDLQNQLDPIRLVATGVSCRDCKFFRDREDLSERFYCGYAEDDPICGLVPTTDARRGPTLCGPDARVFQPKDENNCNDA